MKYSKLFLVSLCLMMSSLVSAESEFRYNVINLQASATNDVANDELIATLMVQENGRNTAKLAEHVNQKMAKLLDKASAYPEIKPQTTSYNTRPMYKHNKIESWQVSQQVKLTSQNFDLLAKLIGTLSDIATVQAMTFGISKQKLESIKQGLTKQAIDNFKRKASTITQQFDKTDYVLVNVSVDGNFYQPQQRVQHSKMMMAEAADSAPALSAGTNTVRVSVNGSIELLDD